VPGRPSRSARDGAGAAPALVIAALALALAGCGADSEPTATGTATGGPGSTLKSTASTPASAPGTTTAPAPGGAESGLPPEAQVDLAIKSVLASGVPGLACRRYATERYVEKTFGSRGGCVQSTLPASAAQTVVVTKIEIDGHRATAVARPSGGPSDGETIRVGLVRSDGVWQVDTLKSNAPVGP
jgi:hypothetical protein